MTSRARSTFLSFVVSACIMVAPFLAGAALLMVGIGVYRMFNAGPKGEAPEAAAGWGIIGPAWPLLVAAVVLGVVGYWAWRKVRSNAGPELPVGSPNLPRQQ